ncbi:MAG: PilZ domain-containing protein [Planctomycetota bacterium]
MDREHQSEGLRLRKHQRQELEIPGVLRPRGDLPRFSSASGFADGVQVRILDVSAGGIGIISPVFFPRGSEAIFTISRPGESNVSATLRLMRVRAHDAAGAYFLGARFANPDEDHTDLFALVPEPPSEDAA